MRAFGLALLVAGGHAAADAGGVAMSGRERVEIVSAEGGEHRFVVRVDGVVAHRFTDVERVEPARFDDGDRGFVLVEAAAAGRACPYLYVIVELAKNRPARVSPEFGTCAEVDRAVVRPEGFFAWMPGYPARPEFAGSQVRRRAERAETRYVWSRGKLTKTAVAAK